MDTTAPPSSNLAIPSLSPGYQQITCGCSWRAEKAWCGQLCPHPGRGVFARIIAAVARDLFPGRAERLFQELRGGRVGGCAGELILNQTAFHASQELVAQCARAGPRRAGRLGASSEVERIGDTQRRGPTDLEGSWTHSLLTHQSLVSPDPIHPPSMLGASGVGEMPCSVLGKPSDISAEFVVRVSCSFKAPECALSPPSPLRTSHTVP